MKILGLENWFLNQLNSNERYLIEMSILDKTYEIIAESEKATRFSFISDFGTLLKWIPKSAIGEKATMQNTNSLIVVSKGRIQTTNPAFEKFAKLKEWARNQGVAGIREKMKKETLLEKMSFEQRQQAAELGLI